MDGGHQTDTSLKNTEKQACSHVVPLFITDDSFIVLQLTASENKLKGVLVNQNRHSWVETGLWPQEQNQIKAQVSQKVLGSTPQSHKCNYSPVGIVRSTNLPARASDDDDKERKERKRD